MAHREPFSGAMRPSGMNSRTATAVVLCALALLGACGDAAGTMRKPSEQPRLEPLHIARAEARHPSAGAAGNIVDCTTWGSGGYNGKRVYDGGATADSPDRALEVARGEGGFGGVQQGLHEAEKADDRVLYIVEVEGVVKQAVVVHEGPATDGAGGRGWYVESWAHCDYSELPRAFTESIGLQVWTDADGTGAPTSSIASWAGPEHCDWQSMTFLHLG